MPSDNELLSQILQQLKRISDDLSILQQDVNCLRNGEYNEPKGAGFGMRQARRQRPASDAGDDKGLGVPSRDW